MIKHVELTVYENHRRKSIDILGDIRVDHLNRVSLKTYKHYMKIAQNIAGDNEYLITIDGRRVFILFEYGKYAYISDTEG